MSGRSFTFGASGNPLVQFLSLLVFGAIAIGLVLMGTVILAVLLGLAVVAAAVIAVRVWWARRKLRGAGSFDDTPSGPRAQDPARLIEGEYTVVDEREPRD